MIVENKKHSYIRSYSLLLSSPFVVLSELVSPGRTEMKRPKKGRMSTAEQVWIRTHIFQFIVVGRVGRKGVCKDEKMKNLFRDGWQA